MKRIMHKELTFIIYKMKKPILSSRIQKYCQKKYPDWICSGEIERLALQAGYKSTNAGRRCREMENGKWSNCVPERNITIKQLKLI